MGAVQQFFNLGLAKRIVERQKDICDPLASSCDQNLLICPLSIHRNEYTVEQE